MADFDVAVIGAGVTGGFIARELSRYRLRVCLLERGYDAAAGASSANSGIVHGGFDAEPGSLKAKFNVQGNSMMEAVVSELGVPYKRTGSLVLAFNETDIKHLEELYERGGKNGVPGLEIIGEQKLLEMEPKVSREAIAALYSPTAGIVCPYELTLGAVENAVDNGVTLMLECEVTGIEAAPAQAGAAGRRDFMLTTGKGRISASYVVNAAGMFADRISAMVGEKTFTIRPRKGEYLLLDKNQGNTVRTVIFQTPSRLGKGILVTPTADGNLLIGPSAVDVDDRDDRATSQEGLEQVIAGALRSVPSVNTRDVITSFAGLRAVPSTGDFIVLEAEAAPGFINAAGIESPGLTSAPAIAKYVAELLGGAGLALKPNERFNPVRKPIPRFIEMNDEERAAAIRQNPLYGHIICRCEKVSEAEVIASIKRTAGARSVDGVKRRTRAGMGRCQGGFCGPRILEILSRELGIPPEEVTKLGGGSRILAGRTKQGGPL